MATSNTYRGKNVEDNELYNTPEIALSAFEKQFGVLSEFSVFYDPCNGLGKISDYIENNIEGSKVYRNDLIDYSHLVKQDSVCDFLLVDKLPEDVECIIMNPAFTLTEKFIDHAHFLMDNSKNCKTILMFNRLTTVESIGRATKFSDGTWNLFGMYVFGYRVSCTKGVNEEKTANSVAYAWYEFNKGCTQPNLYWITEK